MKTSKLSGHLLDYYTGKALGKNVEIKKHQREDYHFCVLITEGAKYGPDLLSHWNPSQNWDIVGPLIDDKKIDTTYGLYTPALPVEQDIWVAMKDGVKYDACGETRLIAVCRLIVWMEYGDSVPDEVGQECVK